MMRAFHQDRLRVYLGGPSGELSRVLSYARAQQDSGLVELTSHWFEGAEAWAGRDEILDDREQRKRITENLCAIRRAQLVWILWPDFGRSEGAVGELGYAVAHRWHVGSERQTVWVSGRRVRSSITTAAADERLVEDDAALLRVLRFAKRSDPRRSTRLSTATIACAPRAAGSSEATAVLRRAREVA